MTKYLDGDFDDKEVSDRLNGDVKQYVTAVSLATSGYRVAVDDAARTYDAVRQPDHERDRRRRQEPVLELRHYVLGGAVVLRSSSGELVSRSRLDGLGLSLEKMVLLHHFSFFSLCRLTAQDHILYLFYCLPLQVRQWLLLFVCC